MGGLKEEEHRRRAKLLQVCGTIRGAGEYHRESPLESSLCNNKLSFSCYRPRSPAQSEGKFNQVIKHFVLKHQLNLMAFPLALSFIAASPLESLSDLHFPVNNRSESETNCNCFSLSIWVWQRKSESRLAVLGRAIGEISPNLTQFPQSKSRRFLPPSWSYKWSLNGQVTVLDAWKTIKISSSTRWQCRVCCSARPPLLPPLRLFLSLQGWKFIRSAFFRPLRAFFFLSPRQHCNHLWMFKRRIDFQSHTMWYLYLFVVIMAVK